MRRMTAAILVLAAAAPAWAQMPTTRVRDCTTAGCHAGTLNHAFLHGPTAVAACDVCHQYADPLKHSFNLKQTGRGLCDFCHIDKVGTEGPVVHDPVAKGDCLSCHDPHGAMDRRLLRTDSLSKLCAECHQDTIRGSHLHTPVGEGRCLDCHAPHTAEIKGLLPAPRRTLCLSCHTDVRDRLGAATHVHDPLSGDCLDCHTTHGSDFASQLKSSPRVLCSSCHQDVEQIALSATHKHPAVLEDRACLNCHEPHASDRAHLAPADAIGACLACHAESIKAAAGHTIAGVPELAVKGFFPHGPIREQECAACHAVHGGGEPRLLTATYSNSFYQPFSTDAYALCFTCHDQKLVLSSMTETETRFRDGTRNLHAVHVNKDPQGRTCRACHDVHVSKTPALIAESVPFGQWRIPLNFTQSATGGSCAPGCHKPARYDRGPARPGVKPAPAGTDGQPKPGPP